MGHINYLNETSYSYILNGTKKDGEKSAKRRLPDILYGKMIYSDNIGNILHTDTDTFLRVVSLTTGNFIYTMGCIATFFATVC